MAGSKWERYAAATGVAGAGLFAVQAFIVPVPPGVDAPLPQVLSYYARNRTGVRVQLFLSGLAGILLLWFLGSLIAHLRRAEGDGGRLWVVALGGVLGTAGPFAVAALSTAVLTSRAGAAGGIMPMLSHMAQFRTYTDVSSLAAVGVLADLRWLGYDFSWFAIAPAVAAVAVISYRHGAFPKWHANFGYALFFAALVAGAGLFFDSGPLAPGGAASYLVFLAFLVWVGVTSGLLMQQAATAEEPPEATD